MIDASPKRATFEYEAAFVTNYLTPYQASLFERTDVAVILCRRPDSRRRWHADFSAGCTVDLSSKNALSRMWKLARIIRQSRRVLIGGSIRAPETVLACTLARALGRPYGLWLERPRRRLGVLRLRLLRALLGPKGQLIAVGAMAQEAYRAAGVARDRVRNFPYTYGRPMTSAPASAAEVNPASRLLLAGSEWTRKGGPAVLAALELLPRGARESVHLTLAGFPRTQLPDPLPLGVHSVGYVQPADMQALLADHSALLLPATFEGWGVIVEEAMRYGLAVIGSDEVGACGMLLIDGYSGIVVTPGDTHELASAIARFAADANLRCSLAAGARARAAWLADQFGLERLLATLDPLDLLIVERDASTR